MEGFRQNTTEVAGGLSEWARTKFGNIKNQIAQKIEMLKRMQGNPNAELSREIELIGEIDELLTKKKYTGSRDRGQIGL